MTVTSKDIYTVSRLNREVAQLLAGSFPLLWLQGEISNFAHPRSGHMYFSVKDAGSQVRAAMFRNRNLLLRFKPEDGMQVLMRVRISLYEPRGDYQLVVEHMEEAGDGALRRAFELLKQKLHAEGLFDPGRKRPLPEYPQRLGVITSATGAAIRDVLSVLRRRYPLLPVLIYPVAVQGTAAADEMIAALRLAQQRRDCDVLLLTRGGGSLEDLQAFNDERLARAIAACDLPVVSAVGHEIDFTIADFVADLRAATPSAAAELISPDTAQLQQQLRQYQSSLCRALASQLQTRRQTISVLQQRLQRMHPQQRLNNRAQRLDELELRLQRALRLKLQSLQQVVARAQTGLHGVNPRFSVKQSKTVLDHSQQRLMQAIQRFVTEKSRQTRALLQNLNAVSPLATLQRGYAIVTRDQTGKPVLDAATVSDREQLTVRLAKGRLAVVVDKNN